MKKSSSIFHAGLIFMMLQGGACKKEEVHAIRQTSFSTPFDLQLSEKILVTSPDRQLMVELRSLNDDRCAEYPCDISGNANVRVFLSDATHKAEAETNLCIGDCGETTKTSDTVSIAIDGVQYNVVLRKVSGDRDKKAELLVKKS